MRSYQQGSRRQRLYRLDELQRLVGGLEPRTGPLSVPIPRVDDWMPWVD